VKPGKQKQSDSASANTPFVRAREDGPDGSNGAPISRNLEGDLTKEGKRFKVILIQEGLGNLHDGFYYTREALEAAVQNKVFEGKKVYANHPSVSEEADRPERDVRDIIAYIENSKISQVPGDGSRACIEAEVCLSQSPSIDWARNLMTETIGYRQKHPDQDFVGLSINAFGDAEEVPIEEFLKTYQVPTSVKPKLAEALKNGLSAIRVTKEISEARSVDLVTEAGAGGKILQLMEGSMKTKKKPAKVTEADQAAADDGQHDDAEQDKKLIADMLKKYLGDGDHSEEDEAEFAKTKEAYSEMGYSEEEAMEAAGHAMKLAKHKQKKEATEKEEENEADPVPPKKDGEGEDEGEPDADDKKAPPSQESEDGHPPVVPPSKESNVRLNDRELKLMAETAAIRKERDGLLLDKHIDQKLQESKLDRSVTKGFMKEAGPFKSVKDFDRSLAVFKKGYEQALQESRLGDFGFALSSGNSTQTADAVKTKAAADFSDCVTK
jgi:hypothetical protein